MYINKTETPVKLLVCFDTDLKIQRKFEMGVLLNGVEFDQIAKMDIL